MPERTLELEYPLAGLDRRLAYPKQRPFTTPYAVNVRPEGSFENRFRGGSRPGLVRGFEQRDSDNPVRLLTVMRTANPKGNRSFTDDFSAAFDYSDWENMGQSGMDFPIDITDEEVDVAPGEFMGGVLRNSAGTPGEFVSATAPYSVQMWFDLSGTTETQGAFRKVFAEIYVRLADSDPTRSQSIRVTVEHGFVAYNVDDVRRKTYLELWVNDVVVQWVWLQANLVRQPLGAGTLRCSVVGQIITVSWAPDPGGDGYAASFSRNIGTSQLTRVGFGIDVETGITGNAKADNFVLDYITTVVDIPPEAVVQATNGNLLRETVDGVLASVTQTNITLASDRNLVAADRLGKLYIADNGNRIGLTGDDYNVELRLTDGVIDAGSPQALTSASVTDWRTYGIETAGDWLDLLAGSGPTLGPYKIDSIAEGQLNLASAPGNGTNLTFRVVRGPKVYDSVTNEMTLWEADTGSVPVGCSIIEIFSERVVLSGDPEYPHLYYMSRWGDPLDFNYGASATDRGRALSNAGASPEFSSLSLPLSAIAALTEDYCMFSAESEMYMLRGDPNLGGIMGNVSRQIGIATQTAWCRLPDGSIVFLSRDGLYLFHPSNPFPEPLSHDRLPQALRDVLEDTRNVVAMEYDVTAKGIHVFATHVDRSSSVDYYWLDWTTKSFWSVVFGGRTGGNDPFTVTYDVKTNRVLFGCRDGYIRHFDAGALDDDGTPFATEIDYGPIPLNRGRAAFVDSLEIVLAWPAGGEGQVSEVSWTFRVGQSPEDAYLASYRSSGTVLRGHNYRQPIRAYGQWAFLRLGATDVQWAVESVKLRVLTVPGEARKI